MRESETQSADPRSELVTETADGLCTLQKPEVLDVEAIREALWPHLSFDDESVIDTGYARIVIEKKANWLPESGRSLKPGNLRFNLGGLFEAIVSGIGAGISASTNPLFGVLAGLVALRALRKSAEIDLAEMDALVAWSVWTCEQFADQVTAEAIAARARAEADRVGSDLTPSVQQIMHSLESLSEIGAVARIGDEWQLVEQIIVKT